MIGCIRYIYIRKVLNIFIEIVVNFTSMNILLQLYCNWITTVFYNTHVSTYLWFWMQICFINRRIWRYIQINPEKVKITWPSVLLKLSLMSVSLEDGSSQSRKKFYSIDDGSTAGETILVFGTIEVSFTEFDWSVLTRNLLAVLTYTRVSEFQQHFVCIKSVKTWH